MTQVGLRRRNYRDRELDQLARDTDANLRGLWDALPAFDLAPAEETDTGYTWRGKTLWMRNFQGVLPNGGTGPLLTGVERVVHWMGCIGTVGGTLLWPPNFLATASSALVLVSGNVMAIGEEGSFEDLPYDITVFYTRVD